MKPIICWDFDETLGYFRPCEFSYLGKPMPADLQKPFLKPGIKELLASLTEFTHIVTTAAIGVYAKDTLEKQDLLKYFATVIGREDGIFTGFGKDYSVVGKRFNIPKEDFPKQLIIVGNDRKKDPDSYYRQIVVIYDEDMVNKASKPIGIVVQKLLEKGNNHFKQGFDFYLESASSGNVFGNKSVVLSNVKFQIAYWGNFVHNTIHPMIINPETMEQM